MDRVHNMLAVFGIVTRINGKRRTPKIEALHRMIERVLRDLEIDKQRRPILSNGWFSSMFEMVTSLFNTTSVKKKKLLHSHAYTVLSHAKCERRIRSRLVVATCYDDHYLGNALHHPGV
jgi:predicted glycosyltransferase